MKKLYGVWTSDAPFMPPRSLIYIASTEEIAIQQMRVYGDKQWGDITDVEITFRPTRENGRYVIEYFKRGEFMSIMVSHTFYVLRIPYYD